MNQSFCWALEDEMGDVTIKAPPNNHTTDVIALDLADAMTALGHADAHWLLKHDPNTLMQRVADELHEKATKVEIPSTHGDVGNCERCGKNCILIRTAHRLVCSRCREQYIGGPDMPVPNAPHQARAVASRPECGCSTIGGQDEGR